jgi:hypothetical protein
VAMAARVWGTMKENPVNNAEKLDMPREKRY